MTKKQIHPRQLHYQLTQEDYYAMRACLSARAAEEKAGSVHTMFFASYRDYITSQPGRDADASEQSNPRFSLSYYDNDPSYLSLERRAEGRRSTGMVAEAECRALLAGETKWILNRHDPLFMDFYDGLTKRMLLPQMMVAYQRETYTAGGLDLSVALDTGIRSSLEHMDFLDPTQMVRSTSGQDSRFLMEVNYSGPIPDDILYLLAETAPRRKLLAGGYRARVTPQ